MCVECRVGGSAFEGKALGFGWGASEAGVGAWERAGSFEGARGLRLCLKGLVGPRL